METPGCGGFFEKCCGSFVDGRLRVIDNPDNKQGQKLASGLATSSYRGFSLHPFGKLPKTRASSLPPVIEEGDMMVPAPVDEIRSSANQAWSQTTFRRATNSHLMTCRDWATTQSNLSLTQRF
jgi:hypothetical protein